MSKAFGIINFAGNDVQVNGMLDLSSEDTA